MTINKKFFTNKKNIAAAFAVGAVLAMGGSVLATSIGTDLSVTGASTFSGGVLAAGSVANDFSGSSGTFKTSTGAVTIGSGAVTISGATTHSSTVAIGSSGTALTQVLSGTCNQVFGNQTMAATSSVSAQCAVTGMVSGDKVFVTFPASASTTNATRTNGGWAFKGASVSTTDGYIIFTWENKVGKASEIPQCSSAGNTCPTTWVSGLLSAAGASIGLGSSTQYWIVR